MGSNSNDDDEDKIQAVLTEISNMQKNLICGIWWVMMPLIVYLFNSLEKFVIGHFIIVRCC